ncbi:MAG: hypothetical protein V4557_13100 [Bacteroidota bacterium]
MEFIKIAYCITVPFLLFLSMVGWKRNSINVLAVTNVLLIGHSVFLTRQLMGMYQLIKSLSLDYGDYLSGQQGFIIRLLAVILLPLLSLHSFFRKNRFFSLCITVLIVTVFPLSTWNTYGLTFKILPYLCLLCSGYALLWLLNKLPYQSPVV